MSYILRADEIMDAIRAAKVPHAEERISELETLVSRMAVSLAAHLGITCGAATFEGTAFAGTCAPFFPAVEGQPLPEVFAEFAFDNAEEWGA